MGLEFPVIKVSVFFLVFTTVVIQGSGSLVEDETKNVHQNYTSMTAYQSSTEYQEWLRQYYNYYYGPNRNDSGSFYSQPYQQPQSSYPQSSQNPQEQGHYPQYYPTLTKRPTDYYSLGLEEVESEANNNEQPSSITTDPNYYSQYYPQSYHHQYHPQK